MKILVYVLAFYGVLFVVCTWWHRRILARELVVTEASDLNRAPWAGGLVYPVDWSNPAGWVEDWADPEDHQ